MSLSLINLSSIADQELAPTINWIINDLKLKQNMRFIFQETWCQIDDETGEPIAGTENPDVSFDGDYWPDTGTIRVCISKDFQYPFVWQINHDFPEEYLRGVTVLNNFNEFFLYFACHELNHIFQNEHEKQVKQVCKILNCEMETLSDFYSIRCLSRFRCAQKVNEETQSNDDTRKAA